MPEGLFQGLISGLVGGVGQGVLDHEQQKHDDAQKEKASRIAFLTQAVNSPNFTDESHDAMSSFLADTLFPSGAGGKSGKGAGGKTQDEFKKIFHSAILPIRLLGKLQGKKDSGGNSTDQLPPTPQRTGQAPASGGGGLPAAPQRSAPMIQAKTSAQQQEEQDIAQRHKQDVEREGLSKTQDINLEGDKKRAEATGDINREQSEKKFKADIDSWHAANPGQVMAPQVYASIFDAAHGTGTAQYLPKPASGMTEDERVLDTAAHEIAAKSGITLDPNVPAYDQLSTDQKAEAEKRRGQLKAAPSQGKMTEDERIFDTAARAIAQKYKINVDPSRPLEEQLSTDQRVEAEKFRSQIKNATDPTVTAVRLLTEQLTQAHIDELKANTGPDAINGWVESMKDNPDIFHEVDPKLRTQVVQAWRDQTGLPAPKKLPQEMLTREQMANQSLNAMEDLKRLVAQAPDAIGPIMGRLGEKEQDFGSPAFESGPQAQLEQNIRTSMAYLLGSEVRTLFPGRPAQQLVSMIKQVSANPKQAMPFFLGSLDAMEAQAKRVVDSVDQARFGGKTRAQAAQAKTVTKDLVQKYATDNKVTYDQAEKIFTDRHYTIQK